MTSPAIHPRLVVDDAGAAIDFYVAALGATELMRFAEPSGKVVQAEVQIGNDVIALTEHDGDCNLSPTHLGGSPLLLTITVTDADAIGDAMVKAGADVVIPIEDRYYGRREGRLRDTAGHLWIVSQHLEDLTADEIAQRLNAH
ncbi:MAG: VOC family protein [Ilumatobacter sp.]|uniref:VOC family protein n=1 Tax=Ilumatobacter sp. TaxID=1967498 RepID=UPI003C723367